MVFTSPLALTTLTDNHLIKVANSYLPFSTGIEVECGWNDENDRQFSWNIACDIPNIMAKHHDNTEKRFRIPSGITGMICLYNISVWLKENCGLNDKSGIHYHIDMGAWYTNNKAFCTTDHWMLDSLDSWKYNGRFNSRAVSETKNTWVTYRESMRTIEFRIGEMTFDYELLIKRITHCQNLVRRLKENTNKPTFSHARKEFIPIWDSRAW